MAKSTSRLGRGLSSLLETSRSIEGPPEAAIEAQPSSPGDVIRIPIDRIARNPNQPRTEFDEDSLERLAESIRQSGILQPVIVRPMREGFYQLIAGERRFRAARRAALESIPAIVRDVSDETAIELALIENLQREDLGPIERARAYSQFLSTYGISIDDLAKRLSESRANVSNYLRLLSLSQPVIDLLNRGELGMGQARALVTIDDPQRQLALARMAVTRNLSVRQVESLAREHRENPTHLHAVDGGEQTARRRHFSELELALTRAAGISIRLKPGKTKNTGQIIIQYGSLEEFERVVDLLGARACLE